MFKYKINENEIFQSMGEKLVTNKIESKFGFDKLAKAADLLNTAASIFEQAGMQEEAADVTNILHELSEQIVKNSK